MKVKIDTEEKTIELLGLVTVEGLLNYVHKHDLHEYVIKGHEESFKYPWPSLPPQENPTVPKFGEMPLDSGSTKGEW